MDQKYTLEKMAEIKDDEQFKKRLDEVINKSEEFTKKIELLRTLEKPESLIYCFSIAVSYSAAIQTFPKEMFAVNQFLKMALEK